MQQVSLRKFPYPYHAAIAFANDIDNTPDLSVFLEFMKFLNTEQNTGFGHGLNLEFSSSFWFFNGTNSPQLSYFNGLSEKETEFAPYCRELWKSGHLDALHTYGNFDEGGFTRSFARRSIEELDKYSVQLKTWINHGNANNIQNIGLSAGFFGAATADPAYHFDLLNRHGIRFAWTGKMTHVLGQNARMTANIAVKNSLQKILAGTRYKETEPKPFFADNELMVPLILQDGSRIWDFQRFVNLWGKEQDMDSIDLGKQIRPKNIQKLIENEGFLIIYTHMCEGLNLAAGIPDSLLTALTFIQEKAVKKELLVASNSRLLTYAALTANIEWNIGKIDEVTVIYVNNSIDNLEIDKKDLQGLTFYCENPTKTRIFFDGQVINSQINPMDASGKPSISVPWQRLKYPEF